MKKVIGSAGAAIVGLTALVSIGAATPAHASGTVHGCPFGDVCIYPQDKGWNGDVPSLKFYTYGFHALNNQYGNHYVLNNQSNGAGTAWCTAADYNTCTGGLAWTWQESTARGQSWNVVDLTPINDISVYPPGP